MLPRTRRSERGLPCDAGTAPQAQDARHYHHPEPFSARPSKARQTSRECPATTPAHREGRPPVSVGLHKSRPDQTQQQLQAPNPEGLPALLHQAHFLALASPEYYADDERAGRQTRTTTPAQSEEQASVLRDRYTGLPHDQALHPTCELVTRITAGPATSRQQFP